MQLGLHATSKDTWDGVGCERVRVCASMNYVCMCVHYVCVCVCVCVYVYVLVCQLKLHDEIHVHVLYSYRMSVDDHRVT